MSEQEQGTQGTEQGNGSAAAPSAMAATSAAESGDLEKVRGLVLQAHPDVVPDLVRGASVDELIASVEPARAAYQAVAERVRSGGSGATTVTAEPGTTVDAAGETKVVAQPAAVPAGGAANVVDPADIPASEKIRRALEAQRKR